MEESLPIPKRSGCFRAFKFTAIAFVALAALVALVGFVLYEVEKVKWVEVEASKHRIAPSEIELVDLVLKPGYSDGSYDLTGRIRNLSPRYTVDTVVLKNTIRDIQPSGGSEIIGEGDTFITVSVPPGQTRKVSGSVRFDDMPGATGRKEWHYVITQIRGH